MKMILVCSFFSRMADARRCPSPSGSFWSRSTTSMFLREQRSMPAAPELAVSTSRASPPRKSFTVSQKTFSSSMLSSVFLTLCAILSLRQVNAHRGPPARATRDFDFAVHLGQHSLDDHEPEARSPGFSRVERLEQVLLLLLR